MKRLMGSVALLAACVLSASVYADHPLKKVDAVDCAWEVHEFDSSNVGLVCEDAGVAGIEFTCSGSPHCGWSPGGGCAPADDDDLMYEGETWLYLNQYAGLLHDLDDDKLKYVKGMALTSREYSFFPGPLGTQLVFMLGDDFAEKFDDFDSYCRM